MPDTKFAEQYQGKITRVERAYQKQAIRYYKELRLGLLDAIERVGIMSPGLSLEITQATGALSNQLRSLSKEVVDDIQEATGQQSKGFIAQGNQVDLFELDFEALAPLLLQSSRADVERVFESSPGLWADNARLALLNELNRLQLANEEEQNAINQLLGTNMQSGRASAYRRGLSGLLLGSSLAVWAASNRATDAQIEVIGGAGEVELKKQAIAVIDERTTDCCLKVHGQIKPRDEDYHLTGTPRFADNIAWPPFHWYCRSSQVLYHERFEELGLSTAHLRLQARAELDARAASGGRVEIHPANALSGRQR